MNSSNKCKLKVGPSCPHSLWLQPLHLCYSLSQASPTSAVKDVDTHILMQVALHITKNVIIATLKVISLPYAENPNKGGDQIYLTDLVLEVDPEGQEGQQQAQQAQDDTGHEVEAHNLTGALATAEAEAPATVEVPRKTTTTEIPCKTTTTEDPQDATGTVLHHTDIRSATFHYFKTIPHPMKVSYTLTRLQMVIECFIQPCN